MYGFGKQLWTLCNSGFQKLDCIFVKKFKPTFHIFFNQFRSENRIRKQIAKIKGSIILPVDHIYVARTRSYNTKGNGSSKEDKKLQPATKSTEKMEKEKIQNSQNTQHGFMSAST